METGSEAQRLRLGATLRQEDRVLPLELFFDLVFVLAITQCTTLMSHHATWEGLGQGMLVLALLWWSWTAYAWLTSVVDPEEGGVRLALFAAMAGFLIAAICVPEAFGGLATEFAVAYGAVRFAQIFLLGIAGRDDRSFRRSVTGLGIGTTIGVGLLIFGSFLDPGPRAAVWGIALVLDMGEPYLFGSEGWHLVPGHFAERHGLIVIIALGESIVAIGLGAGGHLTWGIAGSATLGIGVVAALWWAYFDIVALVSARRLIRAPVGKIQNELARDSYSYIHFLLLAGIILLALGLKKALGHPTDPLDDVPAFALVGGVAVYLLGLVAFRYRHVHTINVHRLGLALLLFALFPVATQLSALAMIGVLNVLLWTMIAYETRGYGEDRDEVRHGDAAPGT
ncbi:MAG TPA: low temperature requirement protein A [Solirubrobacterales bacterium]|nr:low temperature requirement protein A [Solirubrobacterales bacterium]